ncbi:hypothetical protein HG619_04470 [Pseudomonas syringae]|nr:hypothetical protein [Pseudomonas syringae]
MRRRGIPVSAAGSPTASTLTCQPALCAMAATRYPSPALLPRPVNTVSSLASGQRRSKVCHNACAAQHQFQAGCAGRNQPCVEVADLRSAVQRVG